jgi:hypothetical protein
MVVLYEVSGEGARTNKQTFEWFSLYLKKKRSRIISTVGEQFACLIQFLTLSI